MLISIDMNTWPHCANLQLPTFVPFTLVIQLWSMNLFEEYSILDRDKATLLQVVDRSTHSYFIILEALYRKSNETERYTALRNKNDNFCDLKLQKKLFLENQGVVYL